MGGSHGGERGSGGPGGSPPRPPRPRGGGSAEGAGASHRAQTGGRARSDSPPPALPPGGRRTRTDTHYPRQPGEGKGREGSGAAPLTNLPVQLLLPRPCVRQRRAPGTRPRRAPPCPPSAPTPADPRRQNNSNTQRPGGKEGRCWLWGDGFAGGGWERQRGGAEPGGDPPPPPRSSPPSPWPCRRGAARAAPRRAGEEARPGGPRRGEARRCGPERGGRGARGVGPPPPRLGSWPAPAAGTAGCLRPRPGWWFYG